MSQLRPHVTAFASVSWDGRVAASENAASEKSWESGPVAGGLEAQLLGVSDALLVDVSTGPASHVDSSLILFEARGHGAVDDKSEGAGHAPWLACALAGARGGTLAGAGAREARLELANLLRGQSKGGGAVVYSTEPGAAEVRETWGGAARLRGCGGGEWDASEIMGSLALEFGVRRLAVCGGGTLLGALLRAGCVDELWLGFRPLIFGNKGGETLSGPAGSFLPASVRASLIEMKQLEGECFTKWILNFGPLRKRVLRKS